MYLIANQQPGCDNGLIYNTITVISGSDYANPFCTAIHIEGDIYSVIKYNIMSNSYFNGYS